MKRRIKNLLLSALSVVFVFALTGSAAAQTFTVLHAFGSGGDPLLSTNDDIHPTAGPALSGNTLYGTTWRGAGMSGGTVFKVNADASGYGILVDIPFAWPESPLTFSASILYGTSALYDISGSDSPGSVFAVNTDGSDPVSLHNFAPTDIDGSTGTWTNADGANPSSTALILSGSTLYGAAPNGGIYGGGTIFSMNTNGTAFTVLHSFTWASDGASPGGLILSGGTLYGTADRGGDGDWGTVFKMNTDGTGFTTLYSFDDSGYGAPHGLVLSGNTLYATASYYVPWYGQREGILFKLDTDGTGFTTFYSFSAVTFTTNSDGAGPVGLISSGSTLYGITSSGGAWGGGTVFSVSTNGTNFRNLHSFTEFGVSNVDGGNPTGLILSDNVLYGTTSDGGAGRGGTLFSISLGSVTTPQLNIFASAGNVTLTWPTNAVGFVLQSATNLDAWAVWSTVSSDPVLVNGQNAVTNLISGARRFYRLSQ